MSVPKLDSPSEDLSPREEDQPPRNLIDSDDFDVDGGRMSFLDHLEELRRRLIVSIVGIAVGCVLSFVFLDRIFRFIIAPMQQMLPRGASLITTEASEYFTLYFKVGLLGGLLIATPFVLYQVWLFVAPGLYSHEKRFAIPFVFFSSIFFFAGAAFSHYVAFPTTWMFFINFTDAFVMFMPKLGPAFSLYVKMLLGFGLIFQMPVLVMALARMGVVTSRFLLRQFKYATLVIFILGAVLSPGGDIASQLMMAGPMMVLYVFSIGIAWIFQTRPKTAE